MKLANLLKKISFAIFFVLLFSNHLSAQTKEFAEVKIRALYLGKTYVFIYYGNSQVKEYAFKAKDVDNEIIDILNNMGKDGWKISSAAYERNKDFIIFLERDKL